MNNLVLSTRSIDEFISDVANAVVKKANLWNVSEPQTEPDNPLSIKDVVKLTGYTKPTIYGYCQRKEIPHHKKNGRLFFFKSEIISWIKEGRNKTVSETEVEAEDYLSNHKKGLKDG